MDFYFKEFTSSEPEELMFCNIGEIFTLNLKTKEYTSIHKFTPPLYDVPSFYK